MCMPLVNSGYPSSSWTYLRQPQQHNSGRKLFVRALAASHSNMRSLHQVEPYTPPSWANELHNVPQERFALGLFPTPIHPWKVPGAEDVDLWIKRDDLSGMQLSGNKVRKLEFLIAEALRNGSDSVLTVGGIQSNHCRATAVAARSILAEADTELVAWLFLENGYAGLEAHLILRNSRQLADSDPGLVGNLLVERLVGAHIHQVTKEEYQRVGSEALGKLVLEQLRQEGRKPAFIPVGGSNALGTWGYLEALKEIQEQSAEQPFTDIVMACGSGGTSAGLALGNHLSGYNARIHAYGVCDDEEYFIDYINGLFVDLGAPDDVNAKELVRVVQAKGAGYAISQSDELQVVKEVAEATGIILDPTYSGKALFGLLKDIKASPEDWQGRRVLFLHTGGLLSMFDKSDQLQPLVESGGRSHRLQLT